MSSSSNDMLFFYQNGKLITVKQKALSRTILRGADMPLAEQQAGTLSATGLLATDDKGSVLGVRDGGEDESHVYSSYGHDPTLPSARSILGFDAAPLIGLLKHYLLGNGYRAYAPRLMRFCAPDSWSPFGNGGLNAYSYCSGDPINYVDPSGHMPKVEIKHTGQVLEISKTARTARANSAATPTARQRSKSVGSFFESSTRPENAKKTNEVRRNSTPSPEVEKVITEPQAYRADSPAHQPQSSPEWSRESTPVPGSPPPVSSPVLPHHVKAWVGGQSSSFSSKASYVRGPTEDRLATTSQP